MTTRLIRNATLATLATPEGFGLVNRGALICEDGTITAVGTDAIAKGRFFDEEHDLGGALVTPGLVDCHTHLVYGGQRAGEFEQRLGGATYESIAKAGGGIRATVRATREASKDQLLASALRRLDALRAEGLTAIEIKSGYGLSAHDEARCLEVARRLGHERPVTVRTTYLAAHALPDEFAGRPDDYVDALIGWMATIHQERLIDAVDAFCDRIAFTPAQTRRVFEAARELGLPVKLHAEQLSDQDGAALAASFGALSCDHLEHLSERGVMAMKQAGSVAVLLPGAFYFLRDTTLPPIEALRRHRVPMAVATDHNPGSSPALSLLLMIGMACTLFRLTPAEALRGVTVHAARALGLDKTHGSLAPGKRADFAVYDLSHPNELAYWFGGNPCRRVFVAGVPTARRQEPVPEDPRP